MKKNKGEVLESFGEFCKSVLYVNVPNKSLKCYIGLLNVFKDPEADYKKLCNIVLDSLKDTLNENKVHEIFSFTGNSSSGILLTSRKNLPGSGYYFCGSINLEVESNKIPMTIFRLAKSQHIELELFIRSGFINYQVIPLIKGR